VRGKKGNSKWGGDAPWGKGKRFRSAKEKHTDETPDRVRGEITGGQKKLLGGYQGGRGEEGVGGKGKSLGAGQKIDNKEEKRTLVQD